MHERTSRLKRPRDINQLAAQIVGEVTSDETEPQAEPEPEPAPDTQSDKNIHAAELGKLGGKKGGRARAEKLSPERRREIARKAAEARWKKAGT